MKHSTFTFFAFVIICTLPLAACDVTVSDPSEDACKNFDSQCKDAVTVDDNGDLVAVAACNEGQFSQYKNQIGVTNCVRDAKSCSSAQSCMDGAQKK
jgi:hypothetical protein